ncbi:MAG: inositol monophosphatase [Deltaproteobacteria bacterium]|nr:inositol monophosphatase [Deltaproteobacteria bacterium]
MLKTAIEAAVGAGRLILESYPGNRTVTLKGFRDLVTDVDIASESFICNLIRTRFPDHSILSEEAGGHAADEGFIWVVDPLDGTTNYAHHHPLFAVSIGVLHRKKPLIGVIHDPLQNHTFAAQTGGGARLNDMPIHTSGAGTLKHAMIGMDWGHENKMRERMLRYASRMLSVCGTVRVLGSAALAFAYVAAGWIDAYFQPGLKPWDTAAGTLLVKEAGGRCTTMKGAPYRVQCPDCLATNRLIHDELLNCLGQQS